MATAHAQPALTTAGRNGAKIPMPETLHRHRLPFVRDIMSTADKHPYAVVGVIVTVVGIVMAALVTIAITVIGGMFSVYGTMREMRAEQTYILKELTTYQSEIKVLRTYESSVLSRQNFIAGLMSPDKQKLLAEYDRANPIVQPTPQPARPPNQDQ